MDPIRAREVLRGNRNAQRFLATKPTPAQILSALKAHCDYDGASVDYDRAYRETLAPRDGPRTVESEMLRGTRDALDAIGRKIDNREVLYKYQWTLDRETEDAEEGNQPSVAYLLAYRKVIAEEMARRCLQAADLDLPHLEPISEDDLREALRRL